MQQPALPSDNSYIINIESGAETARLLLQHQVVTTLMGTLLPASLDLSQVHRVLDLACGPGSWALAMAYQHPDIEVVGIDLSSTMIAYAQAQAQVQGLANATFRTMDVRHPLAFPDASFELIHARFLLGFMLPTDWPALLGECLRLLRVGGHLVWAETELGLTTSPAYEQYAALLAQALYQAGQSFSPDGRHIGLFPMMGPLLRHLGYQAVQHRAYLQEWSFGTPAYEGCRRDTEVAFQLLHPFLLHQGLATQEQLEALDQRLSKELQAPEFGAIGVLASFCGTKGEAGTHKRATNDNIA